MMMKGSTVILVLVTLGLIVAQTHVEAKSCCVNTTARNCYNTCRVPGTAQATCAKLCGCIHIDGTKCPSNYPKQVLAVATWNVILTTAPSDIIRYCKIGCTSSMCFPTTTPQNSADGVAVDEEVVRCNKARAYECTKGSDAGLIA